MTFIIQMCNISARSPVKLVVQNEYLSIYTKIFIVGSHQNYVSFFFTKIYIVFKHYN